METILTMYSIENRMVITHSEIFKKVWYLASKLDTLSSITNKTLARIAMSNMTSNSFPPRVSAS